jgi:hypothetical protein
MQEYFAYAQDLASFLIIITFIAVYKRSAKRVREIMIIGLAVGFVGEFILSKGLGFYYYRLDNIPLWVGFGHSLLFALVHRIIRVPHVIRHKSNIIPSIIVFVIIFSGLKLYFENDWFGFLCSAAFLLLLIKMKKSRLFFLVMFVIVSYIEIVGTTTLSWYWSPTVMNIKGFIPSANPPSGIPLFYFIFDFVVLHIYLYKTPLTKEKYNRRKVI